MMFAVEMLAAAAAVMAGTVGDGNVAGLVTAGDLAPGPGWGNGMVGGLEHPFFEGHRGHHVRMK